MPLQYQTCLVVDWSLMFRFFASTQTGISHSKSLAGWQCARTAAFWSMVRPAVCFKHGIAVWIKWVNFVSNIQFPLSSFARNMMDMMDMMDIRKICPMLILDLIHADIHRGAQEDWPQLARIDGASWWRCHDVSAETRWGCTMSK